jgi:P-type conjugative transfer protein TrbJ
MTLCNSRIALMGAAAITVFAAAPREADAQLAVFDAAGNAQWVEQTLAQIKTLAQQAQSYGTQLQQYQAQLQQYANMVTNTVTLPQEAWTTAQGDILRVQSLSNTASLLSGNSGSLISRLQSASAYASQAGSLTNIPSQITGYQQAIGNNLSTMGKTLGIQQGMEANDAALLTTLQQHSQSAVGQMQAIQAGNELAQAQATQLMQIQATLSATAQMQATQMAVDADRRAIEDAAMTHFAQPPTIATTGYQQW